MKRKTSSQAINIAAQYQFSGQLSEAIQIYHQILQSEPDNAQALSLLGLAYYQLGQFDDALQLLTKAQERNPANPDVYNYLGLVYSALNSLDNAEKCYLYALQLKPDYVETLNNLGNLLKSRGQLEAAEQAYRRAVALKPDFAMGHNNLGVLLYEQGRLDEALKMYRRAILVKPDYFEAFTNQGNTLSALGRKEEAEKAYRKAIGINPANPDLHNNLGSILHDQGRIDEALECYREVLRLDPGNAVATHIISAATGANSDRAPAQYIEKLFDAYAGSFEAHLVHGLNYSAPEKLVQMMRDSAPAAEPQWDVLDLGCGTGLAGAAVAPLARQLVGVDLSSKMLGQAGSRNIYQRLVHADLVPMMATEPAESYDAVIAADVFVYFGDLDEIVGAVKKVLRHGGLFAFSVESLDALAGKSEDNSNDGDYKILKSSRYAHSAAYLEKLASKYGFTIEDKVHFQVRTEKDQAIDSWCVVMTSA